MSTATTTKGRISKTEPGSNGRAAGPRKRAVKPQEVCSAEELRELFREEVAAAKQRIIDILNGANERYALDAANIILDRVFGKPRQVAEPPTEAQTQPPIKFYEVMVPAHEGEGST